MKPKTDKQGWEKVIGDYPYNWIKVFYSKGSGYESEPHNTKGESIVNETLVEVKGSELKNFIRHQREQVRREVVEEIKNYQYGFIRDDGYGNPERAPEWQVIEDLILALSSDGEKKGEG